MTGETLLAYKMPQVLQRVKQRAPHVRLSLQSLNCYVIRDALLSDEVDLGGYRVGNDDALELMPLGDQSLALVASPLLQHVNFTQYNQHIPCSFIINEPQCIFRQRFEGYCANDRLRWKIPLSYGALKALSSAYRQIFGSAFCRVLPLRGSYVQGID